MVDWEARNHAGKNFRGSKKMTIIKLEFELLATFKHRSKYNRTVKNRCFRCKPSNEDFNHILRCQQAIPYRNKLMQQLNESCLKRTSSCPYTAQKFKIGNDQWLNNEPARWVGPIPMEKVGRLTFEAFVNQIDIGWDQAFHGRICKN